MTHNAAQLAPPVYLTANELMKRWRKSKTAFYEGIQRGDIPKPEDIAGSKLWSVDRIVEIEQQARRQAER